MTTDEMKTLEPALEAELARLQQRIAAIQVLLGHNVADVASAVRESAAAGIKRAADGNGGSGRRGPGVSKVKLRAVRQYMERHGEARQTDIAKDLDENSGSVSLALRHLEAEGDVIDTGRIDRKSKIWRFVGEPERTTNINVGSGVEQGRRR
jgi:hypothetical protein